MAKPKTRRKFIIPSLLDLDYYKLTMMQLVWLFFGRLPVAYAFINRTKKVRLAAVVDREYLVRELDHVRRLRFTDEEIAWLRGRKIFSDRFLAHLRRVALPAYELSEKDGQYEISIRGPWAETILWETLILSIVNELYFRALCKERGVKEADAWREAEARLRRKINILKTRPGLRFSDFGTRRRFSRRRQALILRILTKEIPEQLLGTSNVRLAMCLGLEPIGTFAHELYMIFSGIFRASEEELRGSHNRVLAHWWDLYGEALSIALTDTYGTKFFFEDFRPEQAKKWRGLRQDSGDPFEFGEKAILFYRSLGIDPRTKTIVFSDGLDIAAIIGLYDRFEGRIGVGFGWGTDLMNDFGFETISIVVKAVEACGHPLVKLSDNLAKAMGLPEVVALFKRVFGHDVTESRECRS